MAGCPARKPAGRHDRRGVGGGMRLGPVRAGGGGAAARVRPRLSLSHGSSRLSGLHHRVHLHILEEVELFNRLRSLFGNSLSKENYAALAQFEIHEVSTHVFPLYIRNVMDNLDELINQDCKRFDHVDHLFLWGMLREFLKDRPELLTKPVDRLQLHLLSYLLQHEKLPLDEAKKRVHSAKDSVAERRNQILQEFVNRGEAAWRDKSTDHHLRASYKLARTVVSRY